MNANGSGVIEKTKERKMSTPEKIKYKQSVGYIEKLSNGRWRLDVNLRGIGHHTDTISGTYEDAVVAHRDFLTKLKKRRTEKDTTIEELFNLYNADRDASKKYQDANRYYAAKIFVEYFGKDFLAKDVLWFSKEDKRTLKTFIDWRRIKNPKLRNNTINKDLALITAAFNWGVENLQEEGFAKPFKVKKLLSEKKPIRAFTAKQYQDFLDVCDQELKDFCEIVLLTCGSRKDQIESLTWDKVDLTNLTITVKNKNPKYAEEEITKDFHPDLVKIFERRKRQTFGRSPYVFPMKSDPAKHTIFSYAFKVVARKAGVGWASIHTLRKTWDTWGAEISGNFAAKMAGHSKRVAEGNYIEMTENDRSNLINFIGNKRKTG